MPLPTFKHLAPSLNGKFRRRRHRELLQRFVFREIITAASHQLSYLSNKVVRRCLMSDMCLNIPLIAATFVDLLRCFLGLGLAERFRTQSQFEFEFLALQ